MILIPKDSKGVNVIRHLPVFGYDDAPHGHAEVQFDNVRVPKKTFFLEKVGGLK